MSQPHDTTAGRERGGLSGLIASYPLISLTIFVCTLLGIGLGLLFLPEGWALARKVAGGALGGAGCGLIVTAPRIVG